MDGQISTGDYFLLSSITQGGPFERGMIFRLAFDFGGETVGTTELVMKSPTPQFPIPTTRWDVDFVDKDNIALDRDKSALSRFSVHTQLELNFSVAFHYTGERDTNLSVIYGQNNSEMAEFHVPDVSPGNQTEVSFSLPWIDDYPWLPRGQSFTLHFWVKIRDLDSNQTLARASVFPRGTDYYPQIC